MTPETVVSGDPLGVDDRSVAFHPSGPAIDRVSTLARPFNERSIGQCPYTVHPPLRGNGRTERSTVTEKDAQEGGVPKRLADLEVTIAAGLSSFVAVGEALIEVRDSKLYRVGYATFEAYCKGRWGMTDRRGRQLMEATEAVKALPTGTMVPVSERAARELAPVVREHGPEAAAAVMAEASAATNGHVTAGAIRAVVVGPGATRPKWNPGAAVMSSDSPEWYTPRHILDAVVAAMGGIDLDPCAEPGKSVPATTHYTEADDGLSQEWHGRVYMNPPYGRPIASWVGKLTEEYRAGRTTEAIALVPGRVETDWFYALDAVWLCNIEGRLAFSDHGASAPFPSVAVYLGREGNLFGESFVSLGDVYERRWRFTR